MDPELKKSLEAFIKTQTEKMVAAEASGVEINAAVAAINKEMKALDSRIKERSISLPGSELPDGKRKFSFAKALYAISNKDWTGAEFEKEHFDQTRKRASNTTLNGTNMGFFVSIEQAREILKPAMANLVMAKLGATIYSDLIGDLPFPKVTSRPTLAFGVENVAATASLVDSGGHVMRPKTGKMLVKISNKLNMQSEQVAEQVVREQLEAGIQLGIDLAAIAGSGSLSQPLGILNHASIVKTIVTTGTPKRFTLDLAAQLLAEIEDRDFAPTGILSKPRVFSGMRRERVQQFSGDDHGMPVMNPLITNKALADMLDLVLAKTTQVPYVTGTETSVIAGQWSEYKIGYWGGLQLASSDIAGTAFENNEIWFRAFVDMDTLVAHPEAFEICKDAECLESNWLTP